jgi:hypothetical protein
MKSTLALESHINKFLNNFKELNNIETRPIQILITEAPRHNQPETTIPMDRYYQM